MPGWYCRLKYTEHDRKILVIAVSGIFPVTDSLYVSDCRTTGKA